MKTFYYLLLLFISISFDGFSQYFLHPSEFGNARYNAKFPKECEVYCKSYNDFETFDEWYISYKYNSDNTKLNIQETFKDDIELYDVEFDKNGKITSFFHSDSNYKELYEYDEKGRICKVDGININTNNHRQVYTYENSKTTIISTNPFYDNLKTDSTVIYYYKDRIEKDSYEYIAVLQEWKKDPLVSYVYKLDNSGRIVERQITYNNSNEADIYKYIYNEEGYSVISKGYSSINYYLKQDYIFNSKGDLVKLKRYSGFDLNNMNLLKTEDYIYTYSDPTSNEVVNASKYKVYSTNSNLVIENKTGISKNAVIYSITGQYLKTVPTQNSRVEIQLNAGIYIVTIDDCTYKLKVK